MAQWVDENNTSVNIEKFSLDETADALDYQRDVHLEGKWSCRWLEELRNPLGKDLRLVMSRLPTK